MNYEGFYFDMFSLIRRTLLSDRILLDLPDLLDFIDTSEDFNEEEQQLSILLGSSPNWTDKGVTGSGDGSSTCLMHEISCR